jgi:hypothetical protein
VIGFKEVIIPQVISQLEDRSMLVFFRRENNYLDAAKMKGTEAPGEREMC